MINKLLIGIVIIVVVVVIGFAISTLEAPETLDDDVVDEYITIVEEWIGENAKTYTERGGSDLEYIRAVEVEEDVYELTFDFNANFAGYGEVGEDEMAAQVITPHTIVVTVEDGEVFKAITNEVYDEINEEMIDPEAGVKVDVYFAIVEDGMEEVSSVERELSTSQDIEENTVYELLAGPTQDEEDEGYFTAIDEGTILLSFHVENGVAYPDFSSELDASGSATVMMIREQIENTLLQFENVEEVEISIEGESEGILQP